MKFQKTVEFDLYVVGDQLMEGVIYLVDLAIDDESRLICTGAQPHKDSIPGIVGLCGPDGVDHWRKQVLAHFKNKDEVAQGLIEAMTDEEWDEFQEYLIDW